MHTIKKWLLGLAGLAIFAMTAQAHINPNHNAQPRPNNNSSGINYRENCAIAVNRIDQAINNVRARLTTGGDVWIVETKGREEIDLPQKMARLRQWCEDATEAKKDDGGPAYHYIYVDQESFEQHRPSSFAGLTSAFREYQEA